VAALRGLLAPTQPLLALDMLPAEPVDLPALARLGERMRVGLS
jgi:hypothetical protein